MADCLECRLLFKHDGILEKGIEQAFEQEDLPRGMAERINISLDHEGRTVFSRLLKKRRTAAAVAMAAAIIVSLLVLTNFYRSPSPAFETLNQITLQAVADHLKGNRYTTFDARETEQALDLLTKELGFKVVLPDFEGMGCTLVGGRLCALGKCRAAYFVVEQNGRTGSLFIMDTNHIQFPMADGTRFDTSVKGCDTCVWKKHGQVYAMVF